MRFSDSLNRTGFFARILIGKKILIYPGVT